MFAAAAVCPHPPLLLPEVAQQTAPDLDDLRAACSAAVQEMLEARPDAVVVVGDGPVLARYHESDGGTMRGLGVDVRAGGPASQVLPLSLTVGAWLLDRCGWTGPRRYFAVPRETSAQECAQMGAKVAGADLRVGVLAMGDGSAKRSVRAPGYLDRRAEPFDREVARALAEADQRRLADGLPPIACAELWVQGRAAWQFLAGAASQAAETQQGAGIAARLHYDAAPYGVGYFVATWTA